MIHDEMYLSSCCWERRNQSLHIFVCLLMEPDSLAVCALPPVRNKIEYLVLTGFPLMTI